MLLWGWCFAKASRLDLDLDLDHLTDSLLVRPVSLSSEFPASTASWPVAWITRSRYIVIEKTVSRRSSSGEGLHARGCCDTSSRSLVDFGEGVDVSNSRVLGHDCCDMTYPGGHGGGNGRAERGAVSRQGADCHLHVEA